MPRCPACDEPVTVDGGRCSQCQPSPSATKKKIAALAVGLSLLGGAGCGDDKDDHDSGVTTQYPPASGFLGVDRACESRVPGRRVRRGVALQVA